MHEACRWRLPSCRRALTTIALILGCVSNLAFADVRTRVLSGDQALQIGHDAVAQDKVKSSGEGAFNLAEQKTLANGLYMFGSFSYQRDGGTVVLRLDQISNDSSTRTSGTLRLELWAASSPPPRGTGFTGYRLAVSSTFSPLPPRTFYSNIVRTTTFLEPPAGTYWLILVLTEFTTGQCAGNDNYCVQDTGDTSPQQTFGTQQSSTVTAISRSGEQCYENYPRSAFDLVQQNAPGLFQSYPPSTTCASLGMPFYAGLLLGSADVRVYGTNAAVAQFLCSTGLLTSCTSTPAASYTDLWWNPAESGWGVTITHRPSGIAFITWFTYDSLGNPKWYVASDCRVANSRCSTTLYETHGPSFGASFNPSLVTVRAVGSITLVFSSQSLGTMSYVVNGISGSKVIIRQVF